MKGTVSEVWSKGYAKDLFENAKAHPEVSQLVGKIKSKIRERVDIEQLMDLYHDIKYIAGRSLPSEEISREPEPPKGAVEFVTSVLPDGHIVVPAEVIRRFQLKTVSKMRVIVLHEDE
jgi:hypothetical protein